jgi:hypothetical protein
MKATRTLLEVRCCCHPGKLLGWIDVDASRAYAGAMIKFAIPHRPPVFGIPAGAQLDTGRSTITLTVAWLATGDSQQLAVKSNDHPLDLLRRIPAFREA